MLKRIKFKLQGRSPEWYHVRQLHIDWFPACAACSSRKKLEVHHIVPFNINPALELCGDNLITLCSHCHLVIGHLRDYKIYNDNVTRDAKEWQAKRMLAYSRSKYGSQADRNRPGSERSNSRD